MKSIKATISINRIKTTNLLPVHTSTRETQLLNIITGFTDSGGSTFFRIIFLEGFKNMRVDCSVICLLQILWEIIEMLRCYKFCLKTWYLYTRAKRKYKRPSMRCRLDYKWYRKYAANTTQRSRWNIRLIDKMCNISLASAQSFSLMKVQTITVPINKYFISQSRYLLL